MAEQQRGATQRCDQGKALLDADGRERHRQVVKELGGDAAQADQRNRPEASIAFHADQQLETERQRRLLLDGESVRAQPVLHLAKGLFEWRLAGDPETYAASVALVHGTE